MRRRSSLTSFPNSVPLTSREFGKLVWFGLADGRWEFGGRAPATGQARLSLYLPIRFVSHNVGLAWMDGWMVGWFASSFSVHRPYITTAFVDVTAGRKRRKYAVSVSSKLSIFEPSSKAGN
jgi:hypothetical protein